MGEPLKSLCLSDFVGHGETLEPRLSLKQSDSL